jgi:hypothetical protein
VKGRRLVGAALIVVGLGFAYWGHQESSGLTSQLNEAFSGSPADDVMVKYIGAAAAIVVGALLLLSG